MHSKLEGRQEIGGRVQVLALMKPGAGLVLKSNAGSQLGRSEEEVGMLITVLLVRGAFEWYW